VRCNLILPPDDQVVYVEFEKGATVLDAIVRALRELGGAVAGCQILDDDSVPLNRNLRLSELGRRPDLWVHELFAFEIRSPWAGPSERDEVVPDSTVGDIAADFPGCEYANEAGLILVSNRALAWLRRVLYAIRRESQEAV
jgi:hypothetical protein